MHVESVMYSSQKEGQYLFLVNINNSVRLRQWKTLSHFFRDNTTTVDFDYLHKRNFFKVVEIFSDGKSPFEIQWTCHKLMPIIYTCHLFLKPISIMCLVILLMVYCLPLNAGLRHHIIYKATSFPLLLPFPLHFRLFLSLFLHLALLCLLVNNDEQETTLYT